MEASTSNNHQIVFSNSVERRIKIGENESIIDIDHAPILPKTSFMLGELEFFSNVIFEEYEIKFLSSTEDRFKKSYSKRK